MRFLYEDIDSLNMALAHVRHLGKRWPLELTRAHVEELKLFLIPALVNFVFVFPFILWPIFFFFFQDPSPVRVSVLCPAFGAPSVHCFVLGPPPSLL